MPEALLPDRPDFNLKLLIRLEELIVEYESGLKSGHYISHGSLLAQVDDPRAKAWLRKELRDIYEGWAISNAKGQVAAIFNDGLTPDSTNDAVKEPDSDHDHSDPPPFDGWPEGFRLINSLEDGGTAKVYLAKERSVGRKVVLKVPEQATRSEHQSAAEILRICKRFKREGQTLGRLAARGVRAVPQFHAFADIGKPGWPSLVMEHVQGETLSRVLKARKAGFDEGIYAHLENFARDLHAIHDFGPNHLDLKPSNIIVRSDGSWTALDWGFGRWVGEVVSSDPASPDGSSSHLSSDEDLGATPRYMAPEQAKGGVGWKARKSDVFALGAIQHRILTGLELLPSGMDKNECYQRTLEGRFDEARARLLSMADRDPMARLALDCLETRFDDRPDAGHVADRIGEHLALLKREEQERRERAIIEEQERQKREVRARAWLTFAVSVTIIFLVSFAAISFFAFREMQARILAESKTKEAQRAEFLREAEAADVAMKAGLFNKARMLFAQARERPGATDADRTDLDLKDLRAAMFLNDMVGVDRYIATLSGRADLTPRQLARLDLEQAIREMYHSMNEPGALTSTREGPRDKHILELLARASPNLDDADRHTVQGLQAQTIDEAVIAYQAAMNLEPRHPYASSYLLETNLLAGRFEDALTQANVWAATSPGDPIPWFYRAVLLTFSGHLVEAEKAMSRFRAADGAGRVIQPATVAQCEAMVRVIGTIDEALNDAVYQGVAGNIQAMRKLSDAATVPGGWKDAVIFTAPLPPFQRRAFGGFFSGMADSVGLGQLIKKDMNLMAMLTGSNRRLALADLANTSGFVAPGMACYFQAILMTNEMAGTEANQMRQADAIGKKLDQATEGAMLWDVRGICLIGSAGSDIQRSDWFRKRSAIAAKRTDLFGRVYAKFLTIQAVYLRAKSGATLIHAAALPRASRPYREQLRRVAAKHGDPGVIKAVRLITP